MSLPNKQEMQSALEAAACLREHTDDEHYLGKVLLNLNYRMKLLQEVKQAAKLFLHSGEAVYHHADLIKAIERADAAETSGEADESPTPW